MSAYILFDNQEVREPQKLAEYKRHAPAIVELYRGKYAVLGGYNEILEGSWAPAYPVMLEFPSVELARGWYQSAEYRDLRRLRLEAVRSSAVLIEGT